MSASPDSGPSPSNPASGRIIAVVNQKGGVGKTTTALNVAASLALEGVSTLLVDCDPQANATSGLGLSKQEERPSVYQVLLGGTPATEAVLATAIPHLSIIAGTRNLIGANLELIEIEDRERRLREELQPLRARFPTARPSPSPLYK